MASIKLGFLLAPALFIVEHLNENAWQGIFFVWNYSLLLKKAIKNLNIFIILISIKERYIRLIKKFRRIFAFIFIEKPEETFWSN